MRLHMHFWIGTAMAAAFSATCVAQQVAAKPILYKDTPYGISEQAFLKRHLNAGFVCKKSEFHPGRDCISTRVTLANIEVPNTRAAFLFDKLGGVVVELPKVHEDALMGFSVSVTLVMVFESEYGLPQETRWPEEKTYPNGQKIVNWLKLWKRGGSSLTYQRMESTSPTFNSTESHHVAYGWDRWQELEALARSQKKKDF
jgi:hypothetical protein